MEGSSSGNGQTQRDIGKLEGKMDMLIDMVKDLGDKLDSHIQAEDEIDGEQNVQITDLDKRLTKVETKWALMTAGLVAGVSAVWNLVLWAGKELIQKIQP